MQGILSQWHLDSLSGLRSAVPHGMHGIMHSALAVRIRSRDERGTQQRHQLLLRPMARPPLSVCFRVFADLAALRQPRVRQSESRSTRCSEGNFARPPDSDVGVHPLCTHKAYSSYKRTLLAQRPDPMQHRPSVGVNQCAPSLRAILLCLVFLSSVGPCACRGMASTRYLTCALKRRARPAFAGIPTHCAIRKGTTASTSCSWGGAERWGRPWGLQPRMEPKHRC